MNAESNNKVNNMKTILEEMRNYAGIIIENITPEQLNKKINNLISRNYSEKDIIKIINNLCYNDWVHVIPYKNEKLLKVSINPMNWKPDDGKIDDIVSNGNDTIKNIFRKWIKNTVENELKKYPDFKLWIEKREIV